MPSNNSGQYFVIGSTYLDKQGFNKVNDDEHDYVHGASVIYGPFNNEKDVEEFISDYAGSEYMWPGHDDWKWFKVGQPFILTPMANANACKVVENKSLEFVGQLELNEQRRRMVEIEKIQKTLRDKELDTTRPIASDELEQRILWIETDINRRKQEAEQEEKHLQFLISRRSVATE
jgi:hypothetical protein